MTRFPQIAAVVALMFAGHAAFAQVGQLNGGGGNNNIQTNQGAGAETGGAGQGSTQEGTGGVTTEGVGSSAAQDGGIAGGNQSEVFVGGNNSGGFVGGGGLQNDFTSNRRFQAITDQEVTRGSTAESSGTTRRVPVAFRIGFQYPKATGTSLLMGNSPSPMTQVAKVKPELRGVTLNIDAKGVAVLSGQAPNAAAARLAANLVRLRPGVRKVQNNIRVVLR